MDNTHIFDESITSLNHRVGDVNNSIKHKNILEWNNDDVKILVNKLCEDAVKIDGNIDGRAILSMKKNDWNKYILNEDKVIAIMKEIDKLRPSIDELHLTIENQSASESKNVKAKDMFRQMIKMIQEIKSKLLERDLCKHSIPFGANSVVNAKDIGQSLKDINLCLKHIQELINNIEVSRSNNVSDIDAKYNCIIDSNKYQATINTLQKTKCRRKNRKDVPQSRNKICKMERMVKDIQTTSKEIKHGHEGLIKSLNQNTEVVKKALANFSPTFFNAMTKAQSSELEELPFVAQTYGTKKFATQTNTLSNAVKTELNKHQAILNDLKDLVQLINPLCIRGNVDNLCGTFKNLRLEVNEDSYKTSKHLENIESNLYKNIQNMSTKLCTSIKQIGDETKSHLIKGHSNNNSKSKLDECKDCQNLDKVYQKNVKLQQSTMQMLQATQNKICRCVQDEHTYNRNKIQLLSQKINDCNLTRANVIEIQTKFYNRIKILENKIDLAIEHIKTNQLKQNEINETHQNYMSQHATCVIPDNRKLRIIMFGILILLVVITLKILWLNSFLDCNVID